LRRPAAVQFDKKDEHQIFGRLAIASGIDEQNRLVG